MARRGLARVENKQKRYKVEGSGRRWHVWEWEARQAGFAVGHYPRAVPDQAAC